MISYPGDILRRFGRYEAVEDLGVSAAAHLWGAWDPYLERFVIIAALGDVDPAQLFEGMRVVDAALERWTGGKLGGEELILDFAPGDGDQPPYVVVATTDEDEDDIVEAGDSLEEQEPSEGTAALAALEHSGPLVSPPAEPTPDVKPADEIIRRTAVAPARTASPLFLAVAGALLLAIGAASGFIVRSLSAAGGGDRVAAPLPPLRTLTPTAGTVRLSPTPRESTPTATLPPAESGTAAAPPSPMATVAAARVTSVVAPIAATKPATSTAAFTATAPLVTPTAGRSWRAGKLQIDIAVPRQPLAAGETVKLRAALSGLSAEERSRLECEWRVNGTPRSRVCEELELHADPQPGGAPLRVTLSALGQTKEVAIEVSASAPTPPAAAPATAVATAPKPKVVGPAPVATINTSVSAGEIGVRGAVATYVRDQQRYLVERTGKPDARCVLQQQSLRQNGDSWEATISYTIEIPGQPVSPKSEVLHIVNRGGAWQAQKP